MARSRSGTLLSGLHVTGYRTTVKIIELNAEPTPLTHEGVSDYLIQGKTGEILPQIVDQVKRAS
jgi:NAD-dependent SIR2 family protein deacetylase